MTMNGDAMMLFEFAGEANGVACVGDIQSNFHCFTEDVLSLGWLLTDAGKTTQLLKTNLTLNRRKYGSNRLQ